jgi:hypothetical protein
MCYLMSISGGKTGGGARSGRELSVWLSTPSEVNCLVQFLGILDLGNAVGP